MTMPMLCACYMYGGVRDNGRLPKNDGTPAKVIDQWIAEPDERAKVARLSRVARGETVVYPFRAQVLAVGR